MRGKREVQNRGSYNYNRSSYHSHIFNDNSASQGDEIVVKGGLKK